MSKLSVVIPAWNEEEAIAQVIERTLALQPALQETGITELEILVVDDGSTDGTARTAAQLAAQHRDGQATVRLIRHRGNQGYGAALQTGFSRAQGNLLAFLDADNTYPPEELPALCQEALQSGAALVIGNRMVGRPSGMPTLRYIGNVLFAGLVSLLTGAHVTDCSSGMRVMPVTVWEKLQPLPTGLDFTPAMTVRALHKQLALREVPIAYHERVGRSKLKLVRDGLRFLVTILRETWEYRPGRIVAGSLAISTPLLCLLAAALLPEWQQAAWPISLVAIAIALGWGLRLTRWPLPVPGIAPLGQRIASGEKERAP